FIASLRVRPEARPVGATLVVAPLGHARAATRAAPTKTPKVGSIQTPEQHVDQFLQHLVNAVILGGTYALLGIGLTLIFGIMRVVNFTHGELYAFGAYTVYLISAALGLNFFLGLVVAVVAGALLGALVEIV